MLTPLNSSILADEDNAMSAEDSKQLSEKNKVSYMMAYINKNTLKGGQNILM